MENVNRGLIIGIWSATVPISPFFLWFAFSDILSPPSMFGPKPENLETNPMRPWFRLVFGSMMTVATLVAAAVATARSIGRR